MWLRKYLFTFLFQLVQGIRVYVFKFYGNYIACPAKIKYGLVVIKTALHKLRRDRRTGSIPRGVQHAHPGIVVITFLQKHAAQLSASQNAYASVQYTHGAKVIKRAVFL